MLFYIAKSYFIFLRTSNLRQTKKDKEQEGNALSSVFRNFAATYHGA
jgi:hypothetical protein